MKTKTVGIYRVKNEARWIGESIERTLQVAEQVVVLDDGSTDDTVKEVSRFGSRAQVILTPFHTLDEARDKTFLLSHALDEGAEWIVFLDGDEVFTPSAIATARALIERGVPRGVVFRIAYLWDSPLQERVDALYASAYAPRLFSCKNLRYPIYKSTTHGGNLHCGQLPKDYPWPVIGVEKDIKHYGYMLEEDRARKFAWYREHDSPRGRALNGDYKHIVGERNVLAPGPMVLRPFADT